MKLRDSLKVAGQAVRANLLPGLLLQTLMAIFLSLYFLHDGTRGFFGHVANFKEECGYGFAFFSYVVSSAVLPEILRIAFFQGGKPNRANLWIFFTGAPAWGCMGMLVDLFYRSQALWFGTGNDWQTILAKVAVDQFLFAPFLSNPLLIAYFSWRDAGYRSGALRRILRPGSFVKNNFTVLVAGWCIWIPGVSLVYFMPSALQFPVAVLIQCFWVLIFALINKPRLQA
ncbi:MAG: hypothetical protein WCQ57_08915 [Verrucomicrobiota bacterium]